MLSRASTDDVHESLYSLECASFPPDEAATLDGMILRVTQAPECFYKWKIIDDKNNDCERVIGMINGTKTTSNNVTHESMEMHEPKGRIAVIHSVTIDPNYRRLKHATKMLKEYIKEMRKNSTIDILLLLCKQHLIAFYQSCGFQFVKVSDVVHGADTWFEMKINVTNRYSFHQCIIDAFTKIPYMGNPAAVCLITDSIGCYSGDIHNSHNNKKKNEILQAENWMQKVANENNQSETAFITQSDVSPNIFNIRWFTPTNEVDLCGHATLASCAAIFEEFQSFLPTPLSNSNSNSSSSSNSNGNGSSDEVISFITKNNEHLVCRRDNSQSQSLYTMSFPLLESYPIIDNNGTNWDSLSKNLLNALDIPSNFFKDILYFRSKYDLVVVVSPSAYIRLLCSQHFVDIDRILNFCKNEKVKAIFHNVETVQDNLSHIRGVLVTCAGNLRNNGLDFSKSPLTSWFNGSNSNNSNSADGGVKDYNYCARCFFPTIGIKEDAVTGSAHCCLAPLWKNDVTINNKYRLINTSTSSTTVAVNDIDSNTLVAIQGNHERGGTLTMEVHIAKGIVDISGHTKTTIRGLILN